MINFPRIILAGTWLAACALMGSADETDKPVRIVASVERIQWHAAYTQTDVNLLLKVREPASLQGADFFLYLPAMNPGNAKFSYATGSLLELSVRPAFLRHLADELRERARGAQPGAASPSRPAPAWPQITLPEMAALPRAVPPPP